MSHFFQPTSKVQKDRQIVRETDSRMAKYSRRGLIFNFIAFLICLASGDFASTHRELAIVLVSGMLLMTVLRGFYLFRFEQLYPRGPARWRNAYFVVTLLGGMWWGMTVASITLTVGLQNEAMLLWFYTVVFFSTTAHAFAPYHRFLVYYQFVGLIPAACAAAMLSGWTSMVYAALMLVFFLFLTHQCRLISNNYWEKLEAGYALGKRTVTDQKEHLHSKATLRLNKEFLANVNAELTTLMESGQLGASPDLALNSLRVLHEHIKTFEDVVRREVTLEKRVYNIRHELQALVAEFVPSAEARDLQVETLLSPNLPMRLNGDPTVFAQIIRTMLSSFVAHSRSAAIIVEVQFLREYETAGELYVNVRRVKNKTGGLSFFADSERDEEPRSLALTIAKGLAEAVGGDLSVIAAPNNDYQLRLNLRLDVADVAGQLDFHKNRFRERSILLVNSNPSVVDIKRQELDALGFSIITETQYKRAKPVLQNLMRSGNPIDSVLVYHEPNDDACQQFLDDLREDEFVVINKIIAASESAQERLLAGDFSHKRGFYLIAKPLGMFEIEATFEFIYAHKGDEAAQAKCRSGTIIVLDTANDTTDLERQCKRLRGHKIVRAELGNLKDTIQSATNPVLVLPCTDGVDTGKIIAKVRDIESDSERQESGMAIIGIGRNCSERDIAAYELGFDDYLDLDAKSSKTLVSTLRFWRSFD